MLARGILGELRYRRSKKTSRQFDCVFCSPGAPIYERSIIYENNSMMIVKNDFPYKKWSGQAVSEHLLVVPKRHTLKMNELTEAERLDLAQLLAIQDNNGYSFYIRSHNDTYRSVGHIHGHLFKYC